MKVQITTKVKMFVTMEVDVPDTTCTSLNKAVADVMSDTGTDLEHEKIVEVERGNYGYTSYTPLEEEPLPDKYHFHCENCRKVHKMDGYAVAQLASGHELVHTCDECGNKNDLEPKMIR